MPRLGLDRGGLVFAIGEDFLRFRFVRSKTEKNYIKTRREWKTITVTVTVTVTVRVTVKVKKVKVKVTVKVMVKVTVTVTVKV